MKLIKLTLICVAVCSTIAAIVLVWCDSELSPSLVDYKVLETIWILVAIGTTREICKMGK